MGQEYREYGAQLIGEGLGIETIGSNCGIGQDFRMKRDLGMWALLERKGLRILR